MATLSGQITLDGTPQPNVRVHCVRQDTNILVTSAITDAAGNYSFIDLDPLVIYHVFVEGVNAISYPFIEVSP